MRSLLALIRGIRDEKKSVLVLGAGRTGVALARFFSSMGIIVDLWDEALKEQFLVSTKNNENFVELSKKGVRFSFKNEPKLVTSDCSLLVPSPGIAPASDLFHVSGVSQLEQIAEIELGIQILVELCDARSVVVTGSNGKSTTTALLHFLLADLGFNSRLCGNIGTPVVELIPISFLDEVPTIENLILSVEASSYQLEACKLCRPEVAVMLNLTENHLERHGRMSEYLEAKKNLVRRFQGNETLIINLDDENSGKFCEGILGKHKGLGQAPESDARIDLKNRQIIFKRVGRDYTYQQSRGNLLGQHNLYNIGASILATETVGADLGAAIEAAYKFKGLEHRLEFLTPSLDCWLINDSKATTVSASLAACRAIVDSDLNRKIILLLGGEEKAGSDWSSLLEYVEQNQSSFERIYTFGACQNKLHAIFEESAVPIYVFENLAEACCALKPILSNTNLALLSPGCASFDEFSDFEDRGRFFKAFF